jgi:choline dehydrogenase
VHDELADRVFGAGKMLGWRHAEDINDGDDELIGYTPTAARRGVRSSAASAFLRPALRAGVTLETGVRAERIVFSGGKAIGVAASRGTTGLEYRARKEIIVACGTIESPLLLERSGIGQPQLLSQLGISPQVDSPNVGERVIEQRITMVQVRFTRQLGIAQDLARLLAQGITPGASAEDRHGLLARSGFDFRPRPRQPRSPWTRRVTAPTGRSKR